VKKVNVIKKLTFESIRKNKKRSIATVLAIIVSTALICGTAGLCASAIRSFQNSAVYQVGDFHITVENVKRDELSFITSNEQTADYFFSQSLGCGFLNGSVNEEKPYVYVYALSSRALDGGWGLHLTEGRMPENASEIVISEHIRTNARVPLGVGDTLNLTLGERVDSEGYPLFQSDPFNGEAGEAIINGETRSFKVVGIIQRPDRAIEAYNAPGYSCFTFASDEALSTADPVNVSFTLKNARSYDKVEENLFNSLSSHGAEIVNRDLLEYSGALSEHTLMFIINVGVIVTVIIMVTSVFVIRNSFAISVSEKTKQYGILASVGATSKQIEKSVLFEGLLFGAAGVPLGIASGIIAVVVLLKIVNSLLGSVIGGLEFTYHLPFVFALVSAVLAATTIFFSAFIPSRRAGKISPIEAVRLNREVLIRKNEVKISPLIKKLFGIGGVIAAKNLKRSRKKYRTTVLSLVLSVSVFISLSSFVGFLKKSVTNQFQNMSYNLIVNPFDYDRIDENVKLYKELAAAANSDNYSWYLYDDAHCSLEEYGSTVKKSDTRASLEELLKNYDFSDPDALSEEELREAWSWIPLRIVRYNEEYFTGYIASLGVSSDPDKAVILCDLNGNMSVKRGALEVSIITGKGEEMPKEMTVLKTVSDAFPMGLEGYSADEPLLVVSENYFSKEESERLRGDISNIYISSSDPDGDEALLTDLIKTDDRFIGLSVYNSTGDAEETRRIMLIAEIFLYGFITVITLIGVTNIFNTITTNMTLRQKEFAMLRSVGMTNSEFIRMVRLESVLYGLRSLLIGVPLGIAGSVAFYILFHDEFRLSYVFPLSSIMLSIVFVFIIVGLTMSYSMSKINRQNIIETIRNENI